MEEIKRKIVFPFTAIVGQEKAKLALLCVAVNPSIGGVLLSGDKGTGKSTLVRALADLLPEVEVVADCPFNCNPHNSLEMCDSCYKRALNGSLKVVKRSMRIIDLPLSITVDRLVGTLDIKRALREGVRGLQPGLLAEANRNILYIDEVNLLDDYVADVLLDSAAMGWNIVEREGVSVKHPARFILVGSMNPEEGELRPQILDRFGLYVNIEALNDPEQRMEIVRRVEEFQADPESFYRRYDGEQKKLRSSIVKAREMLSKVRIDDDLLKLLVDTIIEAGIKTHRAEIVTVMTAKAIAALNNREKVTLEDLKKAMELALPHRFRAKPFEQPKPQLPSKIGGRGEQKACGGGNDGERGEATSKLRSLTNSMGDGREVFDVAEVDSSFTERRERSSLAEFRSRGSRKVRATAIGYPHGYTISYVPPTELSGVCDIDLPATITIAASKLRGLPLTIEEEDLRVRVRKSRVPRLTVIILDSSGSMAVKRRISIAKGVASKMIEDSYVKRDSIALIAFRGDSANIVIQPTRKYSRIFDALKSLPTGGKTPLSSALYNLLILARSFKMKNKNSIIKGILITDGKANVSLYGRPLKEEIEILSSAIRKADIRMEIYDSRLSGGIDPAPSLIEELAKSLNAPVHRV